MCFKHIFNENVFAIVKINFSQYSYSNKIK